MRRWRPDRHALVAVGVYLVLGGLWIALSDRALQSMVEDTQALTTYQTYKGWAFVAVMAALAYLLISRLGRQLKALRDSERHLAENKAALQALNGALEQRVAERTLELERANRELESFAYSVSHDLRAPLRAVSGFARLLDEDRDSRLTPEGRQMTARIRAGAERMDALIDDILQFSRVGSSEIERETTDMAALARSVADELAPAYPAAVVEIGNLPPAVGDSQMLRLVWTNLIGNALKYSSRRETPRVEIDGAVEDGSTATYRVRDNGAGFDMAYATRLFGVFQRMHRAEEFPGTGAGLAIVKRIVERHGGSVTADAVVDGGATFRFTLPAAPQGGSHRSSNRLSGGSPTTG